MVNLLDLDLNLLKALDALLSEKSVTGAAEKMRLGQSGMSGAVSRLRQALGDPILVRVGRNYEFTPYALGLAQPVREILHNIEVTLEREGFDPLVDDRRFTIGASDYSTFLVLEPLIRLVVDEAPNVKITIRLANPESFKATERRELDLLLWRPGQSESLASEKLVTDYWVCAGWSENPHLSNDLDLATYLTLPHLRHSLEGTETEADAIADSFQPRRIVRVMTATFSSIPFLLRGTPLLTVLPRRLGLRFAESADIKLTELPFVVPTIGIAMYWHPGYTEDSAHIWLRSRLRMAAQA